MKKSELRKWLKEEPRKQWWYEWKELDQSKLGVSVIINEAVDKITTNNRVRKIWFESSLGDKWRLVELIAARIYWRDELGREL